MDEMNAPAATGVRSDTMGQPTPSPAERPELRLPPPIFSRRTNRPTEVISEDAHYE